MKRKLGLKRFVFLMGTLVFAVAFSGCASAKIEKQSISPLAIITVAGNSSLPWYVVKEGEEPKATKGLLQNAINSGKESRKTQTDSCRSIKEITHG